MVRVNIKSPRRPVPGDNKSRQLLGSIIICTQRGIILSIVGGFLLIGFCLVLLLSIHTSTGTTTPDDSNLRASPVAVAAAIRASPMKTDEGSAAVHPLTLRRRKDEKDEVAADLAPTVKEEEEDEMKKREDTSTNGDEKKEAKIGENVIRVSAATTANTTGVDNNNNINVGGSGGTVKVADSAATKTVAYVVSVTGCGADPITEGGAVLKHSIHRVSSRVDGGNKSKYDYTMFAIYHPSAEACAKPLEKLGYQLLRRDDFVQVSDIRGDFLREHIEKNGCCGEKELIKLEAYTLTDYPIVVHLDLDVIILKPMDEIFDMMFSSDAEPSKAIMWPNKPIPSMINAFYTYDYNMVGPNNPYKPVQGGFLVLRPDLAVYEEFREIVRVGDFREKKGWGGIVGPFYGSMTFHGLIPYYYDALHPGQSVELSRCIYNQMADNPRTERTVNDMVHGKCRTGEAECEDCRSRPLEDVVTTHFTLCQKPWLCLAHDQDIIQDRLCRKLTHEWYRIRSELDQSWGRSGFGTSEWNRDFFFGYCDFSGHKGYQQIQEPYGAAESVSR